MERTMREQLIALIQAEGYDVVTACELAVKTIAEFKASGKKTARYHIGHTSFTIARNG